MIALNKGEIALADICLSFVGIWPPLDPRDPSDPRLSELRAIAQAEARDVPWRKIATHLRKSGLLKYSPDQPRIPAGQPGGGEWTEDGGGHVISTTSAQTMRFAFLSNVADTSAQERSAEPDISQEIMKEATTWLDTPYAPKTDLKRRGGGATKGPDGAADCSGSVWRIYQNAGHGYPYTQSDSFADAARRGRIPFRPLGPDETPREGDVVVYPGHMSVYDGHNGVYSARRSGKPFGHFGVNYFSGTPRYYRYTGQ